MDFDTWEPAYEAILADLGFDRAADERVRDWLAERAEPFDPGRLAGLAGARVAVAGGADTLSAELSVCREADAVVAASAAAAVCRAAGVGVDLMVTDLDKTPETAVEITHEGTPVAVAAHGDNLPALREYVPRMNPEWLLATTQAAPRGPVVNPGGFTDGDRAAFLADEAGAAGLQFPGWAFDDPTVDAMKRRKLRWAERLLHWLERRRGERFGLLDGRREGIALDWL
jgi:hypothetical protein